MPSTFRFQEEANKEAYKSQKQKVKQLREENRRLQTQLEPLDSLPQEFGQN